MAMITRKPTQLALALPKTDIERRAALLGIHYNLFVQMKIWLYTTSLLCL